jgi:uncharacterized repeat protein (TIGR01451 family)
MVCRILGAVFALWFSSVAMAENFIVSNPAQFQSALTAAQANGQNDTVFLEPCSGEGCSAGVYLVTTPLTYTSAATESFSLLIDGTDSDTRILDGGEQTSILRIDTTAANAFGEVIVRNLTFRRGSALGGGTVDGGALSLRIGGERVEIAGSVFASNRAAGSGGAVFARIDGAAEAPIQIFDSIFDANQALGTEGAGSGNGGAVYVEAPAFVAVQVFDTDFTGNSAAANGGGLATAGTDDFNPAPAEVTLFDVSFDDNTAGGTGGGADAAAGNVDVELCGFVANTATGDGGGLHLRAWRQFRMVNSGFGFNTSGASGGGLATAISFDIFTLRMTNNPIVRNTAAADGGGARLTVAGSTATVDVYNNILHGNTAASADDVLIDNDPIPDIPVAVSFFNNDLTTLVGFPDGSSSFGITDSSVLSAGGNIDGVPLLPGLEDPEPSPAQAPGSPTIDAGLNTAPGVPSDDFEGEIRPADGDLDGTAIVDIGMDEYLPGAVPMADLAVERSVSPSPAEAGQNVTYTIRVRNDGPDRATGVVLTETLDPVLSLVSAAFGDGAPCTQPDAVVCAIGEVAADTTDVVVTIVAATPDLPAVTQITSTATVTANESDPDASNNTASSVSQVVPAGPPVADLAVNLVDTPDPVFSDAGNFTYLVTVDNAGPDSATAVVLEILLPDGVTFQSVEAPAADCDPGPDAMGRLTCNLADLPAGNNGSVTVVVTPDPVETPVVLAAEATVVAAEDDPDPSDNSVAVETTVNPAAADLAVTLTSTPDEPTVGEVVTVTATLVNAGPSVARGARLEVTIPADAAAVDFDPGEAVCELTPEVLDCAVGDLGDGDSEVVVLRLTAPEVAAILEFVATASSDVDDPESGNDVVRRTVQVIDVIALIIAGEGGAGAVGAVELGVLLLALLWSMRRYAPVPFARASGTRRQAAGGHTGVTGAAPAEHRHNGRHGERIVAVLLLVAAGVAALAVVPEEVRAQDRGWYAGAALGQASLDYGASDLTQALAGRGWNIIDPSVDDSDTAWKLYGGFSFNRVVALEAAWVDLGEVSTRFGASVPPNQVDTILGDTLAVHPALGQGAVLSAVFRWEAVPERFSLYARTGLFAWSADIDVDVVSGATGSVSGDDSGVDLMYGLGLEWRLNPRWSLTGEWERYRLNDWADVPSVGVKYRFGER